MPFDLTLIVAIIFGVLLLIGIGMIIRNLWLAATDPAVAYAAGRKVRSTVKAGAHTAGRQPDQLTRSLGLWLAHFVRAVIRQKVAVMALLAGPNNAFKPKPLRSANHMAGTACHVLRSTTRLGLT